MNSEAYLRAVIERIADHQVNRIQELLPWNIKTVRKLNQQGRLRSPTGERSTAMA